MLSALGDGCRAVGRTWGLVVLVLLTNLGLALLFAVPLAGRLERDLAHSGASDAMMYGFDYDWWTRWTGERSPGTLAPDVLGPGFAFRNLDLLLRGELPGRLFGRGDHGADPLVLGLGALYLLVQIFLTGGLLSVFRAPQGGWTVRGLVHGSGFYLGRLARVSLLALFAAGAVFALGRPFARLVDHLAREAVSESAALALTLGRHALMLLALLLVHMVSSFAKVVVVREERTSAVLACLSGLSFCARNAAAALGQYVVAGALGVALVLVFVLLDSRLDVSGWRSQLLAFALFEAVLAGRIAIRLSLLASQLELHRGRGGR